MASGLSLVVWLFVAVVAVRHWSTQSVVRGVLASAVAALVDSALYAAGVPLLGMALFVGPMVEESSRTLAARKDRDFSLAQVVLFTTGFVLVELFVKLTRRTDDQTMERAVATAAAATRGMALHLVTTLLLAMAINRSRDTLKAWPIWTTLPLMIAVHAVFNFLVFWRPTAGFFGLPAHGDAPFAYIAFFVVGLACLAAMVPRRFAWKWG